MQLLREFHGHRLCSEQSRRQYDNIEDTGHASCKPHQRQDQRSCNKQYVETKEFAVLLGSPRMHTSTIRYVFMHDSDGGMGSLSDIGNP